jgi:hypothetical protein
MGGEMPQFYAALLGPDPEGGITVTVPEIG